MTLKPGLMIGLLVSVVGPAAAQDSLLADPTVTEVVSGGIWESEGRSGFYRVIVRSGGRGGGRVSSTLTVQWLAELMTPDHRFVDSLGSVRSGRAVVEDAWQTPAAWLAVARDDAVSHWQVYADNEPIRQRMTRASA